jgi:ADP-ribose pyrophosphatase YjhB (NUDIX family)
MRTQIATRCLIVKGDEIILCKNNKYGFCSLPGGGLEIGETLDENIIREFNEEMGVEAKDIVIHDGILGTFENSYQDLNEKTCYGIEVIKKVDVNVDKITSKEEAISFISVKISELKTAPLLPDSVRNWTFEYLTEKNQLPKMLND